MKKNFLIVAFLLLSSSILAQQPKTILVVYYSSSGNTQLMAEAIAEGATSVEDVKVKLLRTDEASEKDILDADAIIIGSPVYNASVAPAVMEYINSWPFEGKPLKNKLGAAFSTGGGISIGEELVLQQLIQAMLIQGMIIVGGDQTESAFGASGITGEAPFDQGKLAPIFLEKGFGLGKRVAKVTKKFNP